MNDVLPDREWTEEEWAARLFAAESRLDRVLGTDVASRLRPQPIAEVAVGSARATTVGAPRDPSVHAEPGARLVPVTFDEMVQMQRRLQRRERERKRALVAEMYAAWVASRRSDDDTASDAPRGGS